MVVMKEESIFRWFVLAWMSLTGVIIFVYTGLGLVGVGEIKVKYIMGILPVILLGLLIYSYIKHKNNIFKIVCYVYIGIGLPSIAVMFFAPMMVWMG